MVVEIFRTNISNDIQAADVLDNLYKQFPGYKINFDLDDCDNILRIEAFEIVEHKIKQIVNERGFLCEVII